MANVKEISKPYKNLFKNQVCIFIKIYDKIQGWDIDNKFVKPISDALVMSEVIEDDNISKMFFCVKGEYSENPHTEIYIFDVKKETFFFDLISRKIILVWTFILKENLDTQKIYKFTYINTLKLLFGWLLCGGKEWTSKDVCSCTINLFRKNLFGGDKI